MPNFQNTVRRLIKIILSLISLFIIRASILSTYGKNLPEPRYDQKYDQFEKYCHTPLNLRFHLVFLFLSSNGHFGTLTLKFFLKPITNKAMTNLQNTVRRRGIIVVRKCFAADHQSDIFELLLWNTRQTPLWPRIWPICKTLSQAFYSLFSTGLFVGIM